MTKITYGVHLDEELLDKVRSIAKTEHRPLNGQLVLFIERSANTWVADNIPVAWLPEKAS